MRTIDALLGRPGLLLLASRERRFGLADCLARCAADEAAGGLGLSLESLVTFGEGGESWTTLDGASVRAAGLAAAAPPLGSGTQEPEAQAEGEAEAAHRLWIFRRGAR